MAELVRREFCRPVHPSTMEGDPEFGFWHALVRDVAYAELTKPSELGLGSLGWTAPPGPRETTFPLTPRSPWVVFGGGARPPRPPPPPLPPPARGPSGEPPCAPNNPLPEAGEDAEAIALIEGLGYGP